MPNDPIGDLIKNPNKPMVDKPMKPISADNEKDYYAALKKKNKSFLVENLDEIESERIASHIVRLYNEVKDKHKESINDRYTEYDEIYRMVPKPVIGADEDMPTYRSPISTVATEVIHANIMNVFFSPKDTIRVIPTEEHDVPKVLKLGIFSNWSAEHEMKLFENCDRLFHASTKNGECPYIVEWVKEYGIETVRQMKMSKDDPTKPLYDPDTQEPLYEEVEKPKLLYNAPKLRIISRKDYYQPLNAIMDKLPDWEMVKTRMTYDEYLRQEKAGLFYDGSIQEILGWGADNSVEQTDYEDDDMPMGKWTQEFLTFYGRLRINIIKEADADKQTIEMEEFEDEYIAVVHIQSQTLCQLRKNKFPLKKRPVGVDYFVPDDEGRRAGLGVVEFMKSMQNAYDILFNQYLLATTNSNNPVGFFTPFGNQRNEKIKIQYGYMYPTTDPNSVRFEKLPPPDSSMEVIMELINSWVQLLFGISDYAAGVESKIDPTAPAKKAEIVVQQGNVRLNAIIKRKNKTMQDIFERWYLLYKENMPPNKFVRVAGYSEENPWKFESVTLSDFSLSSMPDFELTGNILNVNKTAEAQKKIGIYQLLIMNPLFMPQSQQGIQSLHSLTKWLIDGLEETGLSHFLPSVPGEAVMTPEEENARFLQGDTGEPHINEDHLHHIQIHNLMLQDITIPPEIKQIVNEHIQKHIAMLHQQLSQQAMMQQMGGMNGGGNTAGIQPIGGINPAPSAAMGGLGGGGQGIPPQLGSPAQVPVMQ